MSDNRPVVMEKPLSTREAMQLEKLEGVIKRDFAAFYRVGRALAEINERRLYRNENGRTFEQYCRELWELSESRSYELINAADVYDQLQLQDFSAIAEEKSSRDLLPLNEAQIRPLTKFRKDPGKVGAIWREALETAPKGKVTASHVKKKFVDLINQLCGLIAYERSLNYRRSPRCEIIKGIRQLSVEVSTDAEPLEECVFHGGSSDMNKLEKAGFVLFRMDRASMCIKRRSETGGWAKESGPFDTFKAMEEAFQEILLDDRHLRG